MLYVDGLHEDRIVLTFRRGSERHRPAGGLDDNPLVLLWNGGIIESKMVRAAGVGAGEVFACHCALVAVDDEEVVRKFYALVHKELGVVVATTEIE